MAIALSEKVSTFLDEVFPVTVGTKRKDGTVQINPPVWFEAHDGYIWLNSFEGSNWMEHIRRDKDVTLLFADPKNMFRWAQVQGRLVRTTPDEGDAHINGLSARYTGNPHYQKRDPNQQRVIIQIEPTRITGSIDRVR